MDIRRLVSLVAAVIFCITACAYAEVVGTEMPVRVPAAITESEKTDRVSADEYEALLYVSEEMLFVEGICDADYDLKVMLNGNEAVGSGCEFSLDESGKWHCSIPVSAMQTNAVNTFVVFYADDGENAVTLSIYVDGECTLIIDNVYSADNGVCGLTDAEAYVYLLVNGEEAGYTESDAEGRFRIDYALNVLGEDDELSVRAVDIGGNEACTVIDVIPVDILLSAPAVTAENCVTVDIQAIPGSNVQIMLNGSPCGETVLTDENGCAKAVAEGFEDGAMHTVTAVYADSFAAFEYEANELTVYADMTPPEITCAEGYIDETAEGFTVEVSEDCTVIITDGSGYAGAVSVTAGENLIVFDELDMPLYIAAGMEISVSAEDAAGNRCEYPVTYSVLPRAEDALKVNGWDIGETKTLNAMGTALISGCVYVQDEACTLNIAVTGEEGEYALYKDVADAQPAENGAVLPAVIPFEFELDTQKLPCGSELVLEFRVLDEHGDAMPGTERYALDFVPEKDIKWLLPRVGLLVIAAVVFIAALAGFVKVSRKQRILKRNNGIRRRVRAGKRGEAWR